MFDWMSLMLYQTTAMKWRSFSRGYFNTLRLEQNCNHFTDDILKFIFLYKRNWTSIRISWKYVPKIPVNNKPALVLDRQQAIIWTNGDQLYWCILVSPGLDGFIYQDLVLHICVCEVGHHWSCNIIGSLLLSQYRTWINADLLSCGA